MKRKSKKQIIKKKNEFRYHNVVIINEFGKEIKIRHPSYVFLEKGNVYIYVSITHSENIENYIIYRIKRESKSERQKQIFLGCWNKRRYKR